LLGWALANMAHQMSTPLINDKRHRFPPEIIARAVWLYCRVNLSLREVEDILQS